MSVERTGGMDERVQSALVELEGIIRGAYPEAVFEVARAEDEPEAAHLLATVDVEDAEAVLDLVIDRLLELQVEERLPVHVIPVRPLERVLRELRLPHRRARAASDLGGR